VPETNRAINSAEVKRLQFIGLPLAKRSAVQHRRCTRSRPAVAARRRVEQDQPW
jgi:hypothetical protein